MSQEIEKETVPFNRISELRIENYKGINDLTLCFPAPEFSYEPDIFVIGSENGVGKTSVLECCALAKFLAACSPFVDFKVCQGKDGMIDEDFFDKLVRSGRKSARITSFFDSKEQESVEFDRMGKVDVIVPYPKKINEEPAPAKAPADFAIPQLPEMLGAFPDAVILPDFIFFHSFRRTTLGNLDMRNVTDGPRFVSPAYSHFKTKIVKLLMGKSGLFESGSSDDDTESLLALNEMVERFTGGRIDQLKPLSNGTMDLRIIPVGGGESYSFDGLSSGQKEIISTLFTIWHETKSNPKLVLIDEPELHLNASWHRTFVHELTKIAPKNQYILATHSEHVMDSVPANRRILIERRG